MTYIFISISTVTITALTDIKTGYGIMVFGNVAIVVAIYVFERKFNSDEDRKTIIYDNLSLIKPDKKDELRKRYQRDNIFQNTRSRFRNNRF